MAANWYPGDRCFDSAGKRCAEKFFSHLTNVVLEQASR